MDEQNIPIDIHTSKLVEWLISRRHVKKNWAPSVHTVREKINSAIQDMPEHPEILKLLSGAYINYFHCLRIEEILQETEIESKNIFGWYTSQRMKDWREIIKLYEYDNVFLAEASQYLLRNVAYEVPSIRRQIAKCKQIQEDCDRREHEYNKNASSSKDRYYATCKKIGLKGENVKKELLGLLSELPKDFQIIAERCRELQEPRKFYIDFKNFTLPTKATSGDTCLPLLKFVIDHGDATVYQWKHGEAPVRIEKDPTASLVEDTSEMKDDENISGEINPDEIDFGDTVNIDEIDFGDSEELTTGEIDWGDLRIEEGKEEDIDWNIVVGSPELDSSGIILESSGMEGGVATGEEALSILMSEATRSKFINELLELEGFLTQRQFELGHEESILSMTQFASAPKRLQYQNKEVICEQLSYIKCIVSDLTSTKMLHLYLISTSPRYVDRLSKSLMDKLKESDKLLSNLSSIQKKREEAIQMQSALTAQLNLIVSRTKELQINIEKHISLKYKNRPVNLMGGVNAL